MCQIVQDTLEERVDTNYVIGEVVGQSYLFGLIMSFLMQPIGIVFIIIMPCLVIMIMEFVKIGKVVTADKRQKELEEKQKKDDELDELRRRLAELEKQKGVQEQTNDGEGGTDT